MSSKESRRKRNQKYYQKKRDLKNKRLLIEEDVLENDNKILCEYVLGFMRQSVKISHLSQLELSGDELVTFNKELDNLMKERDEFESLIGMDLFEYCLQLCQKCPEMKLIIEDTENYKSRNTLII